MLACQTCKHTRTTAYIALTGQVLFPVCSLLIGFPLMTGMTKIHSFHWQWLRENCSSARSCPSAEYILKRIQKQLDKAYYSEGKLSLLATGINWSKRRVYTYMFLLLTISTSQMAMDTK